MGRVVDLEDLVDVGEAAVLLWLSHKNRVTPNMRRYDEFPLLATDFAQGKSRAWVSGEALSWEPEWARRAGEGS